MNEIDYKFKKLIKEIRNNSYEELLGKIKLNFLKLPYSFQNILQNYFNKYKFWGQLDIKVGNFDEIERKAVLLNKYLDKLIWLYNKLEDYTSKFILFAILNNYFNYDFKSLKKACETKFKHYFDLDILPNLKNKVIIDVGAYYGDSMIDYISCYGENSYKKAYCYEITPSVFQKLQNNLSKYENIFCKNKAVKNKFDTLYLSESFEFSSNKTSNEGNIKIESICLDKDVMEKIDLIKMDIEGDELLALKGAKAHIKNDNPILLVSIYHKNNHLWQIPQYIHSINKNYKFYLRYYGGDIYPTEIVLFAINK